MQGGGDEGGGLLVEMLEVGDIYQSRDEHGAPQRGGRRKLALDIQVPPYRVRARFDIKEPG